MNYAPKDFIATPEGLVFAVVAPELEDGKVLCCLRYRQTSNGWQKLETEQANSLLSYSYPQYLHHSKRKDTACHAVSLLHINQHFQPRERLQALLQTGVIKCPVLQTCVAFVHLLQTQCIDSTYIGITGSLLINAQHAASDIDLVFYDRQIFAQTRACVRYLIDQNILHALNHDDWHAAYTRRQCELSFAEYVWHEQRKANKVMLHGRKIDLSLLINTPESEAQYQKAGTIHTVLQVTDDSLAYDYPAQFKVAAPDIDSVVCFTATYTGQAKIGEWIEVAGQVEVDATGRKRIVVGACREAYGEFIKVVAPYA